ncbi:hypothetical protein OIU77_009724 [Salix suchowensis]|uniref:histone acetyltransferase n=1 Tax=Salix suchowensis TaxID=1278906 RepID=A0ABQ9A6S5_9ROSI|nr:hypothetical protein OIU77_009724 [Salix suchowensis]
MNVQAHLSGQVSNQLPPQQNGNQQMQNLAAANAPPANMYSIDRDLYRARIYMQQKIFEIIMRRSSQPVDDTQKQKFKGIAKRLEEGLFKAAQTKEDYLNQSTLESRLSSLLKRSPTNSHIQRHQQLVNSSSSIGTMIPTPGMSSSGNSNLMTSSVDTMMITSSGCDTLAPSAVNTGSLLPSSGMHGSSFSRSDGNLSNGYQQSPANFSISSGGNMSSMGVQRTESQMIPTPGFINNNNNNQSYMNVESSANSGGFSTSDSAMVSQTQQPKQYIGGQNSRILQNLGSQMGSSNIRSGMQQKSYGFANGPLNGGIGMPGNNLQLVNEPGTSDGYMTSTLYANSPKPLQQQLDQHQRQLMQGDGYGMNNADSFGSGNIYGAVTSVGSIINAQNLSSASLQSMPKTNSSLVNNQSNLHAAPQAGHIKPQSFDQSEKMNFQSSLQQQQLPQHPHQQQQLQQQFQQHQLTKTAKSAAPSPVEQ